MTALIALTALIAPIALIARQQAAGSRQQAASNRQQAASNSQQAKGKEGETLDCSKGEEANRAEQKHAH